MTQNKEKKGRKITKKQATEMAEAMKLDIPADEFNPNSNEGK